MSQSTTPLSRSPSNPAGSPASSPSKASVISALARLKMPNASSPVEPHQPPDFDETVISIEEIQLLEVENTDKARELYNAILARTKGVLFPAMSIVIVTCKIGLALTYDMGSNEREQWVFKATQDIDKLFENKASWDMSEKEVIETYQLLRNSLEHIRLLTNPEHASTIKDIDKKLEECEKNIPQTIEDFNPLVQIADLCVSLNDFKRADVYFINALTLIDKQKETTYKLAKAECLLKYAAVYPIDHPERQIRVLVAQDAVFALEGMEEELCPDQPKISGLTLRRNLLKRLLDLTPAALKSNRSEIKAKIQTCEAELKALRFGLFRQLFALFALAVFAMSAVAFYRRLIVKID